MDTCRWSLLRSAFLSVLALAPSLLTTPAFAQGNGVPRPDHVVMVIDENKPFNRIVGVAAAPYINSLVQRGALFFSSYAIRHPSQPNYIALLSGSTHGVNDDNCVSRIQGENLGSELFGAGFTFAGYSESMPAVGFRGCSHGGYERKHNPWVNFTNVPPTANLPFTAFPSDFTQLPTLSIVVPNQRNDMHDGSVAEGDRWLETHLGPYIDWAMTHHSLFLLTWDEGKNGTDNRILTLMVGEQVQPGLYAERVDHYTVLRTLLEMYGLEPMGFATNRDPITSIWQEGAASSPITVRLSEPAPNGIHAGPATIPLVAEAGSSNGLITRVEFFERSRLLGIVTHAPFTLSSGSLAPGDYYFVAKATDATGARRTSATVPVHVFDPFPPVQGLYQGLAYPTNGVAAASSGSMTAQVSARGALTAQLRLGRRSVRLGGAFDSAGRAEIVTRLPRTPDNPPGVTNYLRASLALDLTNGTDRLEGTLSEWRLDGSGLLDSNVVASLVADRAVFLARTNPTRLAGRYTLLLAGSTQGVNSPGGDGSAAVTLAPNGSIRATGLLGDGTPFSTGAGLAKDGRWPFYVPVQGGSGTLIGWVQFTNATGLAEVELGGGLIWIQTALSNPRGKVYPDGFVTTTGVNGSGYTGATNSSHRILSWTAGLLTCEGGNLSGPFTNRIQLQANGAISGLERGAVTARLAERTGLWQGKTVDPFTSRPLLLRGAVWQSQNLAAGFFSGTNRTGRAVLTLE